MRKLAVAVLLALACSGLPAATARARPPADAPAACPAGDVTYTGAAGDGQWATAGNWSTGRLPAAADDVCIPPGFPIVSLAAPAAVRSLAAAGTSLLGTADLAVGAGGATLAGLDVAGGAVTAAGPLTAGSVNLHGGSLGGAGAQTIDVLRWSGGRLAAAVTVTSTAVLAGDLEGGAGAGLRIAPGAAAQVARDTTLAVPLDDDGQLSVTAGVLRLTGGGGFDGSGTGGYNIAAGATLDWHSGAYGLAAPVVGGPGAVTVSGADVATTGAASLGDASVTAGSLSVHGSMTAGRLSVTGGTLALVDGAQVSAVGYTQAAGGTLVRGIAGPPLAVSGAAVLDGTLSVDRGDLAPPDGAGFPLITYGSLTGSWATVAIAGLDGVSFRVDYGAGEASLTAHRSPAPAPLPPVAPIPAPPPPPEPGVRTLAQLDRGTVLVQPPRSTSGYVPVQAAPSLPNGTVVDARKGEVRITAASSFTDPKRPATKVSVAGAIFEIRQTRASDGRTAVTDLIVRTPPGLARACLPPHKGVPWPRTLLRARPRVSHRTIRHIQVAAKGIVRAFGGVAVLTTDNGSFDMRDRCDGTAGSVSKGRATLFDRIRGRQSRLRARQSRIVKARLFAARRLHLKKVPRPRV